MAATWRGPHPSVVVGAEVGTHPLRSGACLLMLRPVSGHEAAGLRRRTPCPLLVLHSCSCDGDRVLVPIFLQCQRQSDQRTRWGGGDGGSSAAFDWHAAREDKHKGL